MNKGKQNKVMFNEGDLEPLYFTYRGVWYKGGAPTFYNSDEFRFTDDFEKNYTAIKNEIITYYNTDKSSIKTQYIPHDYTVDGWKVLSIWGYMFQSLSLLKKFPTLKKLAIKYPEIISLQISILRPHTRIKAHFGGSNGLVRHHLGINIPGKLPAVGFNLKGELLCWEEGKLISFCESHRHYVWNNTDESRVVLLFDTIHPQYMDKKYVIISRVSCILMMVLLLKHIPILNRCSQRTEMITHKVVSNLTIPFFKIRDFIKYNLLIFF